MLMTNSDNVPDSRRQNKFVVLFAQHWFKTHLFITLERNHDDSKIAGPQKHFLYMLLFSTEVTLLIDFLSYTVDLQLNKT